MSEDDRLGHLESQAAALEADVKNIARAVDQLADQVGQSINRLSQKVDQVTQRASAGTDWGVLAAWSAVLVSLIGGLGYLAIAPMRESLIEVKSEFRRHEQQPGHPTAITKFERLETDYYRVTQQLTQEVKQLDIALQREMRDLDGGMRAEIKEKLNALDTLLQTEIGHVNEKLLIRVETLQAIEKRIAENIATNARQSERLRALEAFAP